MYIDHWGRGDGQLGMRIFSQLGERGKKWQEHPSGQKSLEMDVVLHAGLAGLDT